MSTNSREDFDRERASYLDSVHNLLTRKREQAALSRRQFFCPNLQSPETYAASLEKYRAALQGMLGWPLTESTGDPQATVTLISEDSRSRVYRINLDVLGAVRAYGLLFLPRDRGRYPLVLAQHGGLGAPELAAGLTDGSSANYNALIGGLRDHPVAIFAPQLLVWHDGQRPAFDQNLLDREFRHLGGSRAAMDLQTLRTFLNWLVTYEEIDASRIGMAGLSYGGFYTLYLTALEPRIRVAVSSCFINDRYRYNWEDWVWTGSACQFLDSEVARMICPRPLFLETGQRDEVFAVDGFPAVAEEVAGTYQSLGIRDRFESRTHPGGHEYDPDGKAQAFLLKWL